MDYPWYETNAESTGLSQGDFVPNCPIIIPPDSIVEGEEVNIEVQNIDVIVLSQSCDLANSKIEIVLVCPYFGLKEFIEQVAGNESPKGKRKTIDNLKKGNFPGYHLLNNQVDVFEDYQVIDFKNVYGIHLSCLKNINAKLVNKTTLLPPYREHLSQAFARFFMRVGLPNDINVEGY
jgi:hypothetical protein